MSFLETPRFPDDIAYGSTGGPEYSTRIITYGAGYEQRDILWSYPRHNYDVAYGIRKIEDLYVVIEYFHVMRGRGHAFRYKDFMDFKSCAIEDIPTSTDQSTDPDVGDNAEIDFQLIKTYTKGAQSLTRDITKPVTGSITVSLDDVPQGSGWTIDTTTGIITFSSAPGTDVEVKAGYEFDVPVRFNIDDLNVVYSDYESGDISIPLIEDKYYGVVQT